MPSCFVIMGYGTKTDFQQNKAFDLNLSYEDIIKPAMEDAGFECVRADEVRHAGIIDVPMYERLLAADLVVADLSTGNLNAFYELGVRHALRPRTTIIIAEKGFTNPFDTNRIVVRRYKHMGDGIDYREVLRMRAELAALAKAIIADGEPDSPVYTYLNDLEPPFRPKASAEKTVTGGGGFFNPPAASPEDEARRRPMAELMQEAMAAKAADDFSRMRDILAGVKAVQGDNPDSYVVQQLALATYKAKDRDPHQRLIEARQVLRVLSPERSSDPETLGLWGAVHKRLFELDKLPEDERQAALEQATLAYERGFLLDNDYYNGINYAFLLEVRAGRATDDDAIADRVQARRVRQRVLAILDVALAVDIKAEDERRRIERHYWLAATRIEALFGLGERTAARAALAALVAEVKPPQWMIDATTEQLEKLAAVLPEPTDGSTSA